MRILSIITVCLLGAGLSQAQSANVPAPDYDFGVVKQGQRLTHAFDIQNTGEALLHIERVKLSLPGITSRFRSEVPPGTAAPVTLEWSTSQISGDMDATAIVYTNDARQSQIALHVKATIQPPIEFDPFPAVFFTSYQDEAPEKRLRILNNEEAPLEIGKIEAPENHYSVQLITILAGKEFELVVKVRPGAPLGRYSEPIYIATNNAARPRLQVRANLFVKADLYSFPEDLDFGSISLTELDRNPSLLALLTQTTVVTNRSGPLEIRPVSTDLPFLEISRTPDKEAQQKFLFNVKLIREKLQPGDIRGIITIRTSDTHHPVLEIPVRGEIR